MDQDNGDETTGAREAARDENFDSEKWFADLWALNPWAKPFFDAECKITDREAFERERRNQSLNRWKMPGDDDDTARNRWNVWAEAMLALRERLDEAERWNVGCLIEGSEQHLWAQTSSTNLSEVCLPSSSNFSQLLFPGAVYFSQTEFGGKNSSTGTLQFESAKFCGGALFQNAKFTVGATRFKESRFVGVANFAGAQFVRGFVDFDESRFGKTARFNLASFSAPASFIDAEFSGDVHFSRAEFEKEACFDEAQFYARALFISTTLKGDASFVETEFEVKASFSHAQFKKDSNFQSAKFRGDAGFEHSEFRSDAWFGRAEFFGVADFRFSKFRKSCSFHSADYQSRAVYELSKFNGPATFAKAHFYDVANFRFIRSTVGFDLTQARFDEVPNLIQATITPPPRLDNVYINDPVKKRVPWDGDPRPSESRLTFLLRVSKFSLTKDPEDEARYRVLRGHATLAQDHERELEFHAQEVRCRRFWTDHPWRREKAGLEASANPSRSDRFWFGLLYEIFSDFGRSLSRPFLSWLFVAIAFAMVFSALSPSRQVDRVGLIFSCPERVLANPKPGENAWPHLCPIIERRIRWLDAMLPNRKCVAGSGSSPVWEATALSFQNAFVLPNLTRSESARRTFSCLYGFESKNERFAVVPVGVGLLAMLQSLLSAILIFLFLLALRNMLKLK